MTSASTPTPLNLLSLPLEIRRQIYSHAIPPTRLCARSHCRANPQVLTACPYCADRFSSPEPRQTPSLLLVCKSTYSDSISIFYSKAILEINSMRLPLPDDHSPARDHERDENRHDFLAAMSHQFAFCPPPHLRQIHTAYIWMHASTNFSMHTLRALLKWTLTHAAPAEIHVAAPLVEALMRKRWVVPMAAERKAMVKEIKAVCEQEIWAVHARPNESSGKLELEGRLPVLRVEAKVEVDWPPQYPWDL